MSILKKGHLHTPLGRAGIEALIAHIQQYEHEQAVAATLAATALPGCAPVKQSGEVYDLFIVVNATPGSGESMVYDVLKNGVSMLTGTFTYDAGDVGDKQISLKSLLTGAGKSVAVGDVITVARTYTAGGGPAMAHNSVVIEIGPGSQ